jgi:hypothetical protein
MKQLLPLFLFLLPCLALAQYPSNGNQKITLGEQTTADGLIWRGISSDTTLTAKSDTAAYFVLDTVNINLYTYKASATGRKWRQLGADTASIAYVNTYNGQTVNGAKTFTTAPTFLTALSVASGGTGRTTMPEGYILHGDGTSVDTAINLFWDRTNRRLGIGTNSPTSRLDVVDVADNNNYGTLIHKNVAGGANSGLRVHTNATDAGAGAYAVRVSSGNTVSSPTNSIINALVNGRVGIGTTTPQSGYRLHVVDSVYIGGNVSASAYTTRSDYNLKDNIFDIKYGLNDVMQLQAVEYTYKSNGSKQLGFIAQDIGTILPEVVSFEESMSVNYQAIIPVLTKAIQEQQALIKALEQRIINLENK